MKILEKRSSRGFIIALAIVGIVGVGVFGFANHSNAFLIDWVADNASRAFAVTIGWFLGTITMVIGGLVVNLFHFLLVVANYNQFLGSTAVTVGWVVVRDIVNMGFVLALIAIAIGTILQQQQYHYSQALPKFLAAAILVNFSKTICGLFIDMSQVVMMTFMGAISSAAGGNLAALLGLNKLFVVAVTPERFGGTEAMLGLVVALMFMSLALIVVGIMAFMLTIRIVALWFLIILSPAAFFLMSLPNDRGYSGKWVEQFINNLLLGPVMAFFLWLSLTIVAKASEGISDARNIQIGTELGLNFSNSGFWDDQLADLGSAGISSIGGMSGYILGIVMLMGTLMAAQQLSSAGGSVAMGGLNYFKDYWTGKRGPFNPIRTGREVLGGLGQRWEKRRQEGVQRRIDAIQGGLGMVAKVGRGAVQGGLRRVSEMELPGGRQVGVVARELYQQNIETPLDNAFQNIGLGFGRPFRERIEEQKTTAARDKNLAEQRAGEFHAGAEQVERELHAMEIRRDGVQAEADRERRAGNLPRATQLDDQVTLMTNSINAGRENVNQLRTDADQQDRQAQAAELRSVTATLRYGFARFMGHVARTAVVGGAGYGATGLAGLWGTAAIHGPDMVNGLGRFGEQEIISANEAQAQAVDAVAKKHANKSGQELWEMYSGAKPGYNHTAVERMGIIKALLDNEEFEEGQMEEVRHMMTGQGANAGTMEGVEATIATKYPRQATRPLTGEERRLQLRAGKIKPEDARLEHFPADDVAGRSIATPETTAFISDLIDPAVDKIEAWLKNVPADVRERMIEVMTDGQRQELFRTGKIRPEDMKVGHVNNQVVGDLMDEDVQKMGDFIKKSPVDVRNAFQNQLRARLDVRMASANAADRYTIDAAGNVNLNEELARELRHYAHAGGDMNDFAALDANGGAIPGRHTAEHGRVLDGLMRNIGSISAIGGFSQGALRNGGGEVGARLIQMERAGVSKLLKTGADGYAQQARAAGNISVAADTLLALAQAGAFGVASPNIQTVIEQNA